MHKQKTTFSKKIYQNLLNTNLSKMKMNFSTKMKFNYIDNIKLKNRIILMIIK